MQVLFLILVLSITGCAYGEAPSAELCERKYIDVLKLELDMSKSLLAWEECEKYCPKDGSFESYASALYSTFHKQDEALRYLLSRLDKHAQPPNNLLYAIGESQLNNNLKQDAIATINKLIEEYPDWYGGFHLKGLYLGAVGDIELAQRYFAHAYLEKEGGNNGWTLINLSISNYHLGDHERAVKAHLLCDKVNSRIARMSQPGTDLAAISYIKTGYSDCAAEILSIQAHYDESAVNSPAFKKALKVYEETTGKPLDVVAYYEEHCKAD